MTDGATDNRVPPLTPSTTVIDGLTIRFAIEERSGAETLLLLSPWPESIFAFTQMWPGLASRFSLLALDLPGFGMSEGRPELMAPKAMGAFVARAASHFELRQPHGVGPDIGTPSLLFAAQAHPTLFRSLVIGAGAAVFPLVIEGLLKTLVEVAPENLPQTDPAVNMGAFVDSIRNYTVPDYVRSDYIESYSGDRFRLSGALVRQYPSELALLSPLLDSISTPVQIIVGRNDSYGLARDAEILRTQLRHSRLNVLECGHCAWEEEAPAYESIISAWVNGGFTDV